MTTPIHVTVGINECGEIGYQLIRSTIESALQATPMDVDLHIDAVVFTRMTGAVLPAAHADDVKKLEEIRDFANELRHARIPGAVGVGALMIASRLNEIIRGDI